MGQKCSDGVRPQAITLDELVDLEVGKTLAGSGCTAGVVGTGAGSGYDYATERGFSFPNNGEFEWGGLGSSCTMCDGDWGCACKSAVLGNKPTVVRTGYAGDPSACCIGNLKINGGKTCAPQYRNRTNEACIPSMLNYCSKDGNIFNKQECIEWGNIRTGEAKNAKLNYARTNPTDANVVSFCRTLANAGDGSCDAIYTSYCASNPTHPLCSCISSKANTTGIVNPKCISADCLQNGFITSNMVTTKCPDVINCSMQNNIYNNGMTISQGINIEQNCGKKNDTGGGTSGGSSGGTSGGTSGNTSGNTSGGNEYNPGTVSGNTNVDNSGSDANAATASYYTWIFIIVLFLLIIGGAVMYLLMDDDENFRARRASLY